jgi:hypothetical protein
MRETNLAWKKIPSNEDWEKIIHSIHPNIDMKEWWQEDTFIRETLKLNLSGNRNFSNASYYDQGTFGFYWSSSPYSTYAYNVDISSTQVYPLIPIIGLTG